MNKASRKTLATTMILPLLTDLRFLKQEHFVCASLDINYHLITYRTVFIGTLTATLIHPREIFADPLGEHATAIVVAHNHPSGNAFPSKQDITTTQQLIAAGQILGIPVYDHIIVAGMRNFSFRKNGMIAYTTLASLKDSS